MSENENMHRDIPYEKLETIVDAYDLKVDTSLIDGCYNNLVLFLFYKRGPGLSDKSSEFVGSITYGSYMGLMFINWVNHSYPVINTAVNMYLSQFFEEKPIEIVVDVYDENKIIREFQA
ncbi:MAG: hypothetical protein ISS25_01740 [Nanoarchaeota archaeon]|nr:hypothetical protein [DPANN group archaeon]MBL7116531.1 hypothetical protein [Nanoarchaeota archaeon]